MDQAWDNVELKKRESAPRRPLFIMADDDPEDVMLMRDALEDCKYPVELMEMNDGEALIAYLNEAIDESGLQEHRLPSLILLDLNMPKIGGREVLQQIKSNPRLSPIPVIIFSTSEDEEEINQVYELRANAFISKPKNYEDLVQIMCVLTHFWLDTVKLSRFLS